MTGRVLIGVGGVVLLGSLVAGCGADRDSPEEIDPAHGAEQGQGHDAATEPEGNVIDDEVIRVVDDEADVRVDCAEREVVVTADRATVVLDGACGVVRATGRGSVVEIGSAEKIVLAGVDNEITFAEGDPEVINQGRNTTVNASGDAEG
ncbi:DUF3060 domain-containing protein [Nocardiopsis sp. MG754419]|uniref:DUF3060 domain-containing protein n=1 Tax=Nocardiopsis sp. MG754419 TaxID=2259865 RepID=UPI001BABA39B|nr:DUF3060 domain-containing protein [Nocardiopsis sp. MG754419]MBR8743465.1 hypothetical protein [Nocardiopsis sp. MG754419]